jgi:hypothetical protein
MSTRDSGGVIRPMPRHHQPRSITATACSPVTWSSPVGVIVIDHPGSDGRRTALVGLLVATSAAFALAATPASATNPSTALTARAALPKTVATATATCSALENESAFYSPAAHLKKVLVPSAAHGVNEHRVAPLLNRIVARSTYHSSLSR